MPFRVFFEADVSRQFFLYDIYSHLSPGRHVALSIYIAGGFGRDDCGSGAGVSLELPVQQC